MKKAEEKNCKKREQELIANQAIPKPRAREEIHRVVTVLIEKLNLPLGSKVLDVPMGPGSLSVFLHRNGYKVYGADIDLNQSATIDPAIVRKRADLNQSIPFEDDFFELVVSLEGIEHLENPFQFIREIARVLRKGGYFILSTPNICNLEERLNFLFRGCFYRFIPPEEFKRNGTGFDHQNLMTWVEMKQILEWNGLEPLFLEKDKIKWRQIFFLWPIALLVWLYGKFQPLSRRKKYCMDDNESFPVIFGGSSLIIVSRKATED
ncbi:class I SAM-dependent methyltransferase [Methylacidiphilum caldifontis]|uniref:2-polyprenyl-3-methyl-5-hydroxy-6-metoxy-1, 4-benzoquinol methylase n=1 Tax=Methylacidiphilum caldifontis TaxID=2795386 RepID=A0A4Y8PHJ3_9BACT|nr:class I SAM-dependent methyltransferase [Methylacidiphilum caldifontis]TFE71259.1 2-polyprenyl-3-methyl-5-hydroxy-6-metoxy-1,4-benzoquinol methylase [Methylacidiphilum caldifontis]